MARISRLPRVADYMSRSVVTIAPSATLQQAHGVMRSQRIRHLPVMDQGRLVGMVTVHDLHLMETLSGVREEEATVEEAMTPQPFTVKSDALLSDVVAIMIRRKIGSAVVMTDGMVVGLFTTIDALRALVPSRRNGSPQRGLRSRSGRARRRGEGIHGALR